MNTKELLDKLILEELNKRSFIKEEIEDSEDKLDFYDILSKTENSLEYMVDNLKNSKYKDLYVKCKQMLDMFYKFEKEVEEKLGYRE